LTSLRDRLAYHATPQQIFQISWSLATNKQQGYGPLLFSLGCEYERLLTEGDVGHVVMTLWAMASLGHTPYNLLDGI